MKLIGEDGVVSFLQYLKPIPLFDYPNDYIDRTKMKALAAGQVNHIKYKEEEYKGDWSIANLISWLQEMEKLHGDKEEFQPCILNYGDGFGVEWVEKIPVTDEERKQARLWLEANPEPMGKIRWRDMNPLVDFPEEL